MMTDPEPQPQVGPTWLALESNPDLFTTFASALGLPTPLYSFQDCLGLDPDSLKAVEREGEVKAVVLCFPTNEAYVAKKKEEEEERIVGKEAEGLIFFKQTIHNACGMYALVHALANSGVPLHDGPLKTLFSSCLNKTPEERSALLEVCPSLATAHKVTALQGQTATPPLEAEIEHHFITFVLHRERVIALDGDRKAPVDHGVLSKDGLLEDTAKIVLELVELTGEVGFSMLVLVGPKLG